MSRSGRLRPRLAFVTILAHPTEPGDPPPRPCALNLGDTRAQSGTLGCNRSRSGLPRPRARLALAPHLAELRTVMLRGPLPPHGGGVRGPKRDQAGERSREHRNFPAYRSWGLPAPLHPRRVLGPKEVLATLLCTPRLHVVPCLGPSCPRPSDSSCLKSLALQPQFPLLDFLGYRVQ